MKKLLPILLLLLIQSTFAQNNENDCKHAFRVQDTTLQQFVWQYFNKQYDQQLSGIGIQSITCIRFSVDAQGKMNQLQYDQSIPPVLQPFFNNLLTELAKGWTPCTAAQGQYFILPIQYALAQKNGRFDYAYEQITPANPLQFANDTPALTRSYQYQLLSPVQYTSPHEPANPIRHKIKAAAKKPGT
jgi:hypothetical protein